MPRFEAALRHLAGSFNVLYADQAGTIGYWHTGHVPIRGPSDDPFMPHPGSGGDEWHGFLHWRQLPHILNPTRGWLANWSNKPELGWPNSAGGFLDWGPVQRVHALTRQMSRLRKHSVTVATLERINRIAPLEATGRRRPYRITATGAQELAHQSERMHQVAQVAMKRLSLQPGGAQA